MRNFDKFISNEHLAKARGLLIAVAVFFASVSAEAGTVELVSSSWDRIAVVEFCQGMNAPQRCDNQEVVYNVKRGYVYHGEDKVCYRRSLDPSNPDSGLGPWTCSAYLISGLYTYDLN